MTLRRVRRIESWILAIAILALGLDAGHTERGSPALMAALRDMLAGPITGALTLVAAALLLRSLTHHVASSICAAAGFGWAAVGAANGLAQSAGVPGLAPREAAALAVGCLAFGTLLSHVAAKKLPGYLVSATLLFGGVVASMTALVAMLGYTPVDTLTESMPALACTGLCVVSLGQMFRGYGLDAAVGRLFVPIAIAGAAGVWLAGELIAQRTAASHAQQLGWMIVAAMLLLGLTFAGFTIVRLVSEVIAARRSTAKWQRLLKRQRQTMHARTTALRESRAHYRELFANVPAPVMLTNPSGAVLAANPAMLRLLGAESEEHVTAVNMISFYADPGQRTQFMADWTASDAATHQGEVKLKRIDGELRSTLFTSRVVRTHRTGDIDYIQGAFTDITDLRRAEAAQRTLESHLRLSQKLESVGRLAAGIAHEINTPMQYIGDNVYFLRESYDVLRELLREQRQLLADGAARSVAELIRELRELETEADVDGILSAMPGALSRTDEGIKSVNRIVAAMKELAHPGDGAKASTDVNAVINTAVTVTRNAHKTVAKVELELGALPNALTYKNELCQVFINLIVNAAHAIETAQKANRRAGRITIRTCAEHDAIRIELTDNGCGIPGSVMDKIFDPFFTTKEVGKGTGQGLALARTTIVEKHGGQIAVHSEIGQGSTFTITIPLGNHDSASN